MNDIPSMGDVQGSQAPAVGNLSPTRCRPVEGWGMETGVSHTAAWPEHPVPALGAWVQPHLQYRAWCLELELQSADRIPVLDLAKSA
jgi:hypothetical protein